MLFGVRVNIAHFCDTLYAIVLLVIVKFINVVNITKENIVMKYIISFLQLSLLVIISLNCHNSEATSSNIQSGIEGRIYSIGAPAEQVDWSPPPLERVSTIIILDNRQTVVKEISTDNQGRFSIILPPGVYSVRVKESPFPATTGPYTVSEGHIAAVEAHYDNGVR